MTWAQVHQAKRNRPRRRPRKHAGRKGSNRDATSYKHLLDINAGFDQAICGLAALRKHDGFPARELDQYSAFAKEVRAATNSYLIGAMEGTETAEAGRRFGKRREREQREE